MLNLLKGNNKAGDFCYWEQQVKRLGEESIGELNCAE
jgi:hypothetical protein